MATAETQEVLSLGPFSNGMLLNPWEYDAADFEPGWRYELVYGVLIVNPAPLLEERDPNEELGRWLRNYQESHPEGSSLDFTVSEQTVHIGSHRRRVDRAIWAGLGRLPAKDETPTIAVEFVSEGKRNQERDYRIKREEYRTAGMKEYWAVDRFKQTLTVYQFSRSKITESSYDRNETYSTPRLPGFELPVGKLLELANRWDA